MEEEVPIGSSLGSIGWWRTMQKSDKEVRRIKTVRSIPRDWTVEGNVEIETNRDKENHEESHRHIPHTTCRMMSGSEFGCESWRKFQARSSCLSGTLIFPIGRLVHRLEPLMRRRCEGGDVACQLGRTLLEIIRVIDLILCPF